MSPHDKARLGMGFSHVLASPHLLSAEALAAALRPIPWEKYKEELRESWDWWALPWGSLLRYLV